MKQAKTKSIYTIVCFLIIVAVFATTFSFATSTSGVAHASFSPLTTGAQLEIFYNHDFSGSHNYYSALPDNDWGSQVQAGYGARFYTDVDYTKKSFYLSFTNDNVAIDINGYNIKYIAFDGARNYIYDKAGNGNSLFIVENSSTVTAQGGDNTTFEATVNKGKLIADGSDKTYYKITLAVGSSVEFRNGRILYARFAQDYAKLTSFLTAGYAFVAYTSADRCEFYPYSKADVSTFDATKAGVEYLAIEQCSHDSITDGVCDYCNMNIDATEAIATAKREIETAKEDLIAQLASKQEVGDLANSLNEQIRQVQDLVNNNKDTQDAALKKAISDLEAEITAAKSEVNAAAEKSVTDAKTELTEKINAKADTTTLNQAIDELNTAITNAISTSKLYADDKDAALKNSLLQSIEQAKTDANTAATNAVNAAKEELTEKINTKADTAALNKAISDLNDAIDTAKGLSNTYADDKDAVLKTALEKAIENAKAEAANTAQYLIDSTLQGLDYETKIDAKADVTALNKAISDLNKAIETAKVVSNTYADDKDSALKTALEQSIEDAKTAANTVATKLVEDAKSELLGTIDTKADKTSVKKAIEDLTAAIETAKGLSNTYADDKDAALKNSLLQSIEQAKTDANTAATNAVKEATKDLNAAIEDKADTKTVEQKVNVLNNSIANAQTVSEQYADAQDALLKAELERELSSAQVALQAAIDVLSQRLDSAEKQIANADSQVKLVQTVIYVVCAFVAVLCALIIAMAVVFKRAVKQCMDKANKN